MGHRHVIASLYSLKARLPIGANSQKRGRILGYKMPTLKRGQIPKIPIPSITCQIYQHYRSIKATPVYLDRTPRQTQQFNMFSTSEESFKRFKDLPDELRQLIWGFVLEGIPPQILRASQYPELQLDHKPDLKRDLNLFWSNYNDVDMEPDITVNSVMATCFESREVALKQYKPIRTHLFPDQRISFLEYSEACPVDITARQYFSPVKDSLALHPSRCVWYSFVPEIVDGMVPRDFEVLRGWSLSTMGLNCILGEASSMQFDHLHIVQNMIFCEDNWRLSNGRNVKTLDRIQEFDDRLTFWQCAMNPSSRLYERLYAAFPCLRRVEVQACRPGSELKERMSPQDRTWGIHALFLTIWQMNTEELFRKQAEANPGFTPPTICILSDLPERFAEAKAELDAAQAEVTSSQA